MTVDEFKDQIAHFWRIGKGILGRRGKHPPQVIIFDREDRVHLIAVEGIPEGRQLTPAVEALLKRLNGTAFILIGEAWTLTRRRTAEPMAMARELRGKVHQQPDREEALLLTAARSDYQQTRLLRFSHNAAGEIVFGIEESDVEGAFTMGGDLLKLLTH